MQTMSDRETSHDFSSDLFSSEERSVLNQIRREGKLDSDREVSRLLNILNDILNENTRLSSDDQEFVYGRLKRFLKFEYHKTLQYDLEHDERYVWYLSIVTCLDQFKKQLSPRIPESKETVLLEFNTVVNGHMRDYLSKFSRRNNIEDLGSLLNPKFEEVSQLVNYSNEIGQRHMSVSQKKHYKSYMIKREPESEGDTGRKKKLRI